MNRYQKLNLIIAIVLGLGLIYLGSEVQNLQGDVKELESRIVEAEIIIDNGTAEVSEKVQLTRGATALEGLERVATVKTKHYGGMGEMIRSINGVSNNRTSGKFWLIGYRNSTAGEWKSMTVSASEFELNEGQDILFWYGKSSNAPFGPRF